LTWLFNYFKANIWLWTARRQISEEMNPYLRRLGIFFCPLLDCTTIGPLSFKEACSELWPRRGMEKILMHIAPIAGDFWSSNASKCNDMILLWRWLFSFKNYIMLFSIQQCMKEMQWVTYLTFSQPHAKVRERTTSFRWYLARKRTSTYFTLWHFLSFYVPNGWFVSVRWVISWKAPLVPEILLSS
jgi:hypothetical protein